MTDPQEDLELHCPNCGHAVPIDVPGMSLGRYLGDQLDESPSNAVNRALAPFLPPAPAAFIKPAVTRYAEQMYRRRVHNLEAELLGAENKRAVRKQKNWSRLMTQTFSIGHGERVAWGKATVEHHLKRIALLEQNAQGLRKTQDQHRWVIEKIQQTPGAQCLLDVPMSRLDTEMSPLPVHDRDAIDI